jgi:hypothetical protein
MPQRIERRLKTLVACYLFICYGLAWGAVSSVTGPDLTGLPWVQAFVGVLVSWTGGFAATLNRMVIAGYDNRPFHSAREFMRDGAVSTVVGLAGYWGGMSRGMADELVALLLVLGGYGGTQTLAKLLGRKDSST